MRLPPSNIIDPRRSTKRSRFSAEVAPKDGRILAGVDVQSSDLPLHRLPENREGGAERCRGESGLRRLTLRE
jgi:hypothetical protein